MHHSGTAFFLIWSRPNSTFYNRIRGKVGVRGVRGVFSFTQRRYTKANFMLIFGFSTSLGLADDIVIVIDPSAVFCIVPRGTPFCIRISDSGGWIQIQVQILIWGGLSASVILMIAVWFRASIGAPIPITITISIRIRRRNVTVSIGLSNLVRIRGAFIAISISRYP